MADRDAFLRAIAAAPDDDAPRLVYADWLDEHGDADRAAFVRLQCEAARLTAFDAHHTDLRRRARALFEAHGRGWLAADWPEADPAQPVDGLSFDRGFFARVSLAGRRLGPDRIESITAARPALALVRDLDLSRNPVGAGGLAALAGCPWVGRLERLDLSGCAVEDDAGWAALAGSPHLAALRSVTVTCRRSRPYLAADMHTFAEADEFDEDRAAAVTAAFRAHGRGAVLRLA